jgi:hypothetical protein
MMRFQSPSIQLVLVSAATILALGTGPITAAASDSTRLTFGGQTTAQEPQITVLSSDQDEVHLVFDLPVLEVETHEVDGEMYQTLAMPGGELRGAPGEPALPAFTRLVAIPARAGATVEIISSEAEFLDGYRVLPMQSAEAETFEINAELYARDEFLGDDKAAVGSPGIMRDLRVIPLTFQPVRFNPAQGKLEVTQRIEVRVDLRSEDATNARERGPVPLTPAFDEIYRSMVVNYGSEATGGRSELAPYLGTWVIISRDNSTVVDLLQPLIEWRRRMGYNVVAVTTTDIGSTSSYAIRTWLREAYAQWPYPPDFVTIVGDVGGAFGIGTFDVPSTYGEGDHPFSQLDGDDLFPDAFVGRLSAEDYITLETIVSKIVTYETDPHAGGTDWLRRATLVGDPSQSGPTCVQIMQWVKVKLRTLGYTEIDTVWSYPFASQITASINQGSTFFGYRGYLGMSGWSTGQIYALTNTDMLPFALNPTCASGSWTYGTAVSEAWLRAGSPGVARGGIGSIGTDTAGTHTRYNNCLFGGVAYGLFYGDNSQLGVAHARGKLELIAGYADYEYTQAERYCYWNTLMADPATEMWVGAAEELNVSYLGTVPVGANVVTVRVRSTDMVPIPNAWVYLYKEGELGIGGYTDHAGVVDFPIDTGAVTGSVDVTVSGHNLHPHQGSLTIAQIPVFVGMESYSVDDDESGASAGNGDGQINPGETVEIGVTLKNHGTMTAEDVVLTASFDDPNIGNIQGGPFSVGSILPGASVTVPEPIVLRTTRSYPVGERIEGMLTVESGFNTWHALLDLPVTGPQLVYKDHTLGGFGAQVDPGESGTIAVELQNTGYYPALGPIDAILVCDDYEIMVTDPYAVYASSVAPEASASNDGDPFEIRSPWNCVPGKLVGMRLILRFADGVRDTAHFALQVGDGASDDPTGPDAYGYLAYDNTDTSYPQAPVYEWIDIYPGSGGPGTSVGLTDYGHFQDDTETLDLPFTFRYYGEDFDRVSICSNGWLVMGSTYLVNYHNWALPVASGPDYLIAPFWDNLRQQSGGDVCYWFDEVNHRYVVAWDNVRNYNSGSPESFEVILYDPAHYPTRTGDGEIVFQYEVVNNNDTQQMYCTAGIQNGDHTSGITFSYFGHEPPTAAYFGNGLAVKYTTQTPGAADIPSREGSATLRLLLDQNTPNPVGGATTIRFQLDRPREVALRIYDVDGHLVRTLLQEARDGGRHAVTWSGLDAHGRLVPSGVYFYRLDTGTFVQSRKLLVTR